MNGLRAAQVARPEIVGVMMPQTNLPANRRRNGRVSNLWLIVARPFRKSIYVRFQYAFGLSICGLALMAIITVVSNRVLLSTYENSVSEARFELMPIHHLQESLRKMDHFAYHYVMKGDLSAIISIKETQEAVDRHFNQLMKIEREFTSVKHAHSHISISEALKAWQEAQAAISEVLRQGADSGAIEAIEALTRAHAAIDPIYDTVSEFHHFSIKDLEERLSHARSVASWTYFAMLGAILIGLGVLTIMGLIVGRSILQPIAELQVAAGKLTRQDFSYRVRLRNKTDELGQLGRGFNIAFSSLQRLYRELEKRSTHDGLTGALNRPAFDERLITECKTAERHKRSLSILMVDIDFFKRVNDNHGHQAGDRVLQGMVRLLNESVRPSDIVARYGGEEFVVILPDSDEDSAIATANRLRTRIEKHPFECAVGENIGITVSIGCASRTSYVTVPDDLIKAADAALFKAKESGRNRVVSATELLSAHCANQGKAVA